MYYKKDDGEEDALVRDGKVFERKRINKDKSSPANASVLRTSKGKTARGRGLGNNVIIIINRTRLNL